MPRNALFSAIPVTMPGSAIGSTTSRLTELLPKKSNRCSASASSVPSSSAMPVATLATSTLVSTASRAPCERQARPHHSVVRLSIGQVIAWLGLNELPTTTSNGR